MFADAHAYQGAGTITAGGGCGAGFATPVVPGRNARILADGVAAAPYIEVAGIYLDTAAGLGKPPNPPPTGLRWSNVGTDRAGRIRRAASARSVIAPQRGLRSHDPCKLDRLM